MDNLNKQTTKHLLTIVLNITNWGGATTTDLHLTLRRALITFITESIKHAPNSGIEL